MSKRIARLVPGFLKPTIEQIRYSAIDLLDRLKRRDSMIPPESMVFVGNGDFEAIGQEFKRYFIELGGLRPADRVLDVGCGIGRMAIPLTEYLSPAGEYWGFDIVQVGIRWCQSRITPRFPNFHFLHSNIRNKNYNPRGRILARDFQFPFESDSFDFVFLTSVFTHMLRADMERYLTEIARVLKSGGRALITFFLLNEESLNLARAGRSTLDFKYEIEGCRTANERNPEAALAYDEAYVRRLFDGFHLKIAQPIRYGSWCKRDTFLSYQDIIVATKERSP